MVSMTDKCRYTVKRIDDFNLIDRPFLSGIFGSNADDIFIDSDLHECNLREILFRSFRAQGYKVVFYNTDPQYNFYSFAQEDLLALFSHLRKSSVPIGNRYHANIPSPFAHRRRAAHQTANLTQTSSSEPDASQTEYKQIQCVRMHGTEAGKFYRIANNTDPFDVIISNANKKIAVIFDNAIVDEFPKQQSILTRLTSVRHNYNAHHYRMKLVAIYLTDRETIFEGTGFFCDKYFQDVIVGTTDKNKVPEHTRVHLYNIPSPDKDEFRNMMNRYRLLKGYESPFRGHGIEKLSLALSQRTNTPNDKDRFNYEKISSYENLLKEDYAKKIHNMNTESSKEKLEKLIGIDSIKEQFYHLLDQYKESKMNPEIPCRPHMAFMGNPGTGKTTVARIFADILREEGVLERGHLVQATVTDMVAGYVGQTRIKTQAICDRAKGGVLFIDEAYGLMSGKNDHGNADFGAEAIEVLIQFMENNDDSLVILAGYKDEIEDLINNGNIGFSSRIQHAGRFLFEDYPPEILYQIFEKQFKGERFTPEFENEIKKLISVLYSRRNFRWGNAREMENLANTIREQHKSNSTAGEYCPDDISGNYKRLISPEVDVDSILKDINEMKGLAEVKEALTTLLNSAAAERYETEVTGETTLEVRDLNFIFLGNPGTGKTTVAKKLARILFECGLIEKPNTVEMKIGDIVSSIQGETAKNIDRLFKDHTGEVIFIDEAYELSKQGQEAITPLISILSDSRFRGKQALVLAGYTDDMNHLMSLNSGFISRFNYILNFADYSNDELVEILLYNMAKEKTPVKFNDPELCSRLAINWFQNVRETVAAKDFGNARLCGQKGLLAILQTNKRTRLMKEKNRDKKEAFIIKPEDFPNYMEFVQTEKTNEQIDTF